MQQENQRPQAGRRGERHRHTLVLPVFVLAIFCSSVVALAQETREVSGFVWKGEVVQNIQTDRDGEIFAVGGGGVQGFAFPQTIVSMQKGVPELVQGSVLFLNTGRFDLLAAGWRMMGLHGSVRVFLQGDALTVAALSSPVLLGREDGWYGIIPVGMQWHGQTTREQESPRLPVGRQACADTEQAPSFERGASKCDVVSTTSLVSPVGRFFSLRETPPSFLREQESVLRGMGASVFHSSADHLFLPSVLTEEERALLCIHPLSREQCWVSITPELADQDLQRLLLLSLPQSEGVSGNVLPIVRDKWAQDMQSFLEDSANPGIVLDELTALLQPLISRWEEQGYVERALQYGTILSRLISSYSNDVHRSTTRRIRAVEALLAHVHSPLLPVAETHPLVSLEKESGVIRPSEASLLLPVGREMERKVYEILRSLGAVFTVQTTLQAVSASEVKVSGMVFGGAEQDKTLDFVYDLEHGEVRDIVEGIIQYPFPLPLERFVEWAKS